MKTFTIRNNKTGQTKSYFLWEVVICVLLIYFLGLVVGYIVFH